MEYKDYYKILGVAKQATPQEIKSAYRALARKYHPDLHPGDKTSEERFKEINEAHDVLGDPEKRKKYDELGANWEEVVRNREYASRYTAPGYEWGGEEAVDFGDFFEMFFGGLGGRRPGRGAGAADPFAGARRAAGRGSDARSTVELTLEEALHGVSRRLQLSMERPCPRCQGAGVVATEASGRRGGRKEAGVQMITCPECRGQGAVPTQRTLDVKIPRGVTEGSRVRLAGMGNPGAGGPPGDLYLEVHLLPHRLFRIEGHDLVCDLPIRDDEAALGATIEAPTLDGRVSVKVPPGSQSGSRLRLKEKGMPQLGGGGRGALLYELKIVTPAAASDEERQLMERLRRLREQRGENPRRGMV